MIPSTPIILYHYSGLTEILTEFRRTTPFFPLKDTVEVAQVVETTLEADFRYAPTGIDKHPRRRAEAGVDDIVGKVATCVQFKETAEGTRTHPGDVGQLVQT